ncbi:MAG TPA: molecular chaperone DnaJ [Candidatus Polarisedimenticolia bacterium]|nr:molecular chaperone DnaJ [Candidatus Polarisedimenticolia bacterium]
MIDAEARIQRSRAILQASPDNPLARFGLATALEDAGRAAEAAAEYARCLELKSDWMAAAIGRGRCLVGVGRGEEAREVLAAARRMAAEQGHSSPLEEIAELEARCG